LVYVKSSRVSESALMAAVNSSSLRRLDVSKYTAPESRVAAAQLISLINDYRTRWSTYWFLNRR
jgi:hypothetical protein